MDRQRLGKSDLQVSRLCFGCNVFGWTTDEQRSFELLDALEGSEINFLDTANIYQTWVPGHVGGESETIIGRWLKRTQKRSAVVIATKVGKPMGDGGKGLSKQYVLHEVERSLRRLQTDYIDLYQSHEDDPNTPLEETLSVFAELIRQGKVRAIGASNFKGSRLAKAIAVSKNNRYPAYVSVQPHYNLAYRKEFETDLEPICKTHGLAVLPYWSLASGFLTGKYRSVADLKDSARGAMVKRYMDERGFRVVAALADVAKRVNATQGQVALAWLMARPVQTIPIASATTLTQFHELVEAARLKLDRDAITQLDAASAGAVSSPA